MKQYKLHFYGPDGQEFETRDGSFSTKKSAVSVAGQIAAQLERGRDFTPTYDVELLPQLDETGAATDQWAQERKKGRRNTQRTQKPFTFRLDNDLANAFAGVANKGRLINNLLRKALLPAAVERDRHELPDDVQKWMDEKP